MTANRRSALLGTAVAAVAVDGHAVGEPVLADSIRLEANATLRDLYSLGCRVDVGMALGSRDALGSRLRT